MKSFKSFTQRLMTVVVVVKVVIVVIVMMAGWSCGKREIPGGEDDLPVPENYGTLEVDFELPVFSGIQKGIRRADLAVCYTMDDMYRGRFFFRTNVSDAKEYYQVHLPEGTYYYQAAITCTCGGDSCIMGGFPYGYGGMKYAFDKVVIEKGKKTVSKPSFQ